MKCKHCGAEFEYEDAEITDINGEMIGIYECVCGNIYDENGVDITDLYYR